MQSMFDSKFLVNSSGKLSFAIFFFPEGGKISIFEDWALALLKNFD